MSLGLRSSFASRNDIEATVWLNYLNSYSDSEGLLRISQISSGPQRFIGYNKNIEGMCVLYETVHEKSIINKNKSSANLPARNRASALDNVDSDVLELKSRSM